MRIVLELVVRFATLALGLLGDDRVVEPVVTKSFVRINPCIGE